MFISPSKLLAASYALSLSFGLCACRTSSSGSTAKEASSSDDGGAAAIKAQLPPGLVKYAVPADQIEKYLPTENGGHGIPDTLGGIWWTDTPSLHWVVSFKNVLWNEQAKTAYLLFHGPQMYSESPSDEFLYSGTTFAEDTYDNYGGYDFVFKSADYKGPATDYQHAQLLKASNDPVTGMRSHEDPALNQFVMDWQDEHLWTRKSAKFASYPLRRIVKPDGSRDADYPNYLAYMKKLQSSDQPVIVVDFPAPWITASNRSAKVTLARDALVPAFVNVNAEADLHDPNTYQVLVEADFPVHIEAYSNTGTKEAPQDDAKRVRVVAFGITSLKITAKNPGTGGTIRLSLADKPVPASEHL